MRHAPRVTQTLDIALLPAEALTMAADYRVVVDVLRATTTIATLFAAGLDNLLAADDIDVARSRAKAEKRLLFGEVNGLPPAGFDHGNSPEAAFEAPVAGRGAVLFTTNGTRALTALAKRGPLTAGALVNASAIARDAVKHERVVIVCAGSAGGTQFALDDFAAAAAIAQRIAALAPAARLGDAARMALGLAATPGWVTSAVRESQHAGLLGKLGLGADVEFALREDIFAAVPAGAVLENGDLRLFNAGEGGAPA
jgi:2-phosphosulfolactate phosphatase